MGSVDNDAGCPNMGVAVLLAAVVTFDGLCLLWPSIQRRLVRVLEWESARLAKKRKAAGEISGRGGLDERSVAVDEEIKNLSAMLETFRNPSTYSQYAKLERKLQKLFVERKALMARRSDMNMMPSSSSSPFTSSLRDAQPPLTIWDRVVARLLNVLENGIPFASPIIVHLLKLGFCFSATHYVVEPHEYLLRLPASCITPLDKMIPVRWMTIPSSVKSDTRDIALGFCSCYSLVTTFWSRTRAQASELSRWLWNRTRKHPRHLMKSCRLTDSIGTGMGLQTFEQVKEEAK